MFIVSLMIEVLVMWFISMTTFSMYNASTTEKQELREWNIYNIIQYNIVNSNIPIEDWNYCINWLWELIKKNSEAQTDCWSSFTWKNTVTISKWNSIKVVSAKVNADFYFSNK